MSTHGKDGQEYGGQEHGSHKNLQGRHPPLPDSETAADGIGFKWHIDPDQLAAVRFAAAMPAFTMPRMFHLPPLPVPSPMKHRHLTGDQLGLAEIDDIIGRGDMGTWMALRNLMKVYPDLREQILHICKWKLSQPEEDFPEHYRFWQDYLQRHERAPPDPRA